jgi:hypothetical protein
MTDNQHHTESGTERALRLGTLALTMLSPVLNTLAARLADRLEQGGKHTKELAVEGVQTASNAKQPLGDALRSRGEVLVQELEELVERGTKLSQSLVARGGEASHELVERANAVSHEILKRSAEIRKELRKRGKKLNKDLSKRSEQVAKQLSQRSEKVAKELSRRSAKVTKELSKRGQQTSRQISERSGTFWIVSGFVVGLAAAGVAAYILIKQRVRQQQQLEEEQSFSLPHNGYINTANSTPAKAPTHTPSAPTSQASVQPAVVEESVPAIAVAEQENKKRPVAPTNAAFVGVIGTKRYYPVATPLEQLVGSDRAKNVVVYFTTEEEAKGAGYASGL